TTPELARRGDPENRWLWRVNSRRLDAEQVRDAILAVSGELDLTAGGSAVEAAKPRRSVYTRMVRNTPDPLLKAFDAADGIISTPQRNVTTTPTQALLMLNSEWMLQRSRVIAERVTKTNPKDETAAVRAVYRQVLSREPSARQLQLGASFLRQQAANA